MGEFDLIERIRARAAGAGRGVLVGIGDDCALLQPEAGRQLAISTDTLNQGVHFHTDVDPAGLGHKSLAVSLSDLAAMGAQPLWGLLNLSMPQADAGWLDAFMSGFLALAEQHQLALVGGDTCAGPLSITTTVLGELPAGQALLRSGAAPGHQLWVSGVPGEAALALQQLERGQAVPPALRARLERPQPRVALGLALRGLAGACIDLSDGLLADSGHLADASGCAVLLELERLPCSGWLAEMPREQRWRLQLQGGDDYELCFSAAPGQAPALAELAAGLGLALHRVGQFQAGEGVRCTANGEAFAPGVASYEHFAAGQDE